MKFLVSIALILSTIAILSSVGVHATAAPGNPEIVLGVDKMAEAKQEVKATGPLKNYIITFKSNAASHLVDDVLKGIESAGGKIKTRYRIIPGAAV
ncbi:hypothetical protein HK102_000605, partial [Quaeritorhiza haematococci]